EKLQTAAALDQIGIGSCRFSHRRLHVPNIRDLAAEVKMQQLEAIEHVTALQLVDGVQNFAHCQAELAPPASGRLPPPAAAGGQFDAHADLRSHADFLSVFQN